MKWQELPLRAPEREEGYRAYLEYAKSQYSDTVQVYMSGRGEWFAITSTELENATTTEIWQLNAMVLAGKIRMSGTVENNVAMAIGGIAGSAVTNMLPIPAVIKVPLTLAFIGLIGYAGYQMLPEHVQGMLRLGK